MPYEGNRPRLVLKGYWGDVRKALKVGRTSRKALIEAQKRGDLRNLTLLGNNAGDADDDGKEDIPVCLNFRVLFPLGYNTADKYEAAGGSYDTTYLNDYPNFFGAGYNVSADSDLTTDNAAGFAIQHGNVSSSQSFFRTLPADGTTAGGFPLLKNCPFAVRFEVPGAEYFAVYTVARWGTVSGRRWQVQLIDGALYIMRLSDEWTQDDEDDLFGWLSVESPTTEQLATIDTLTSTLYRDRKRLNFGDKDSFYGRMRMLVFFPEPCGTLRIWDGVRWGKVKHSDIVKTRRNGTLWDAGTVTVGIDGPAYFWQLGYPLFAESGTLFLARYPTPSWMTEFTTVNYNAIEAQEGNSSHLTGTTLTYTNNVGLIWSQFQAEFSTTDRRYSPLLYALAASVPAGERTGSTGTAWDSDEHTIGDDEAPPFLDVKPSFEGEMKKRAYTLDIIDHEGVVFALLGGNYDSGQWRVCDLYEGENLVLSNGVIASSVFSGVLDSEYNQVRYDAASGASVVTMVACSQEFVLEKWPITEDPIGDGLRVGGIARQILNLPGIPAAEYSSISANTGRRPSTAMPGEEWAVKATPGVMAMDYLRDFMLANGNGRHIFHGPDGWVMQYRPTTLFSIDGHDAAFDNDTSTLDVDSYPGRWKILAYQDIEFRLDDYANIIIVVGAEDAEGKRICQVSRYGGDIISQTVIPPRTFTGFPVQLFRQDDGWKTLDDLALIRRSLALTYHLPPRYSTIKTFYHSGLMPGHRITVNGTPARVIGVSGSYMDDEMDVAYRELVS